MNSFLRLCRTLALFTLLWSVNGSGLRAGPIVTGTDAGASPLVRYFPTPGQAATRSFFAYSADYIGGVRVALGDVNGDGAQDIITAPGGGIGPVVRVFDGNTGAQIRSFNAFDPGFQGGVFVAAGDIDGDGSADIIASTGAAGSTTQVRVFRGTTLAVLASFAPYGNTYTGGALVAAGDFDGDGFSDIITGSGVGTGQVKVFDGRTRAEISSFIAFNANVASGVFVAAGDVNGDGNADIIAGAGPGGPPQVKVFRGRSAALLRSFFAYEQGFTGGVRVGAGDINNDGRADIITAPGGGHSPQVKAFNGRTGALLTTFQAYDPNFITGTFAAGAAPPPILVRTNAATDVTVTTATLHGTVDTNGRTVTVKFQYGLTTSYGTTVDAVPAEVSGNDPTNVSAEISELLPDRTYHFRVTATDEFGGTVFGADRTFTTDENRPPSGGSFAVTPPSPVPAGTVLTATFTGWLDPEGHTPLRYEVREGMKVIVPKSEDSTVDFILSPGTHRLTGVIFDSLGASVRTDEVEVVVEGESETQVVAASREPVPGAGTGGVPPDAVWTTFGVPAIADDSVQYLAKFKSPTGNGSGVFSDGSAVVLIGDPVPGAGAGGEFAIPEGAVFKRFKDPVTDRAGNVAFIATISGPGVTTANDTVVVSNGAGSLEVLAREGFAAPETDGAKYAAFKSVSVGGYGVGGTIFTASLKGAVRPNNNQGAWWKPASSATTMLLVRTGDPGFAEGETIKSFALLQTWPGTPGHGRGQVDGDQALLQVTFNNGQQAQVLATPDALTVIARTGDSIGTSSVWVRMAQPSAGNGIQFLSVRGSFRPTTAPPSSVPRTGILASADSGVTWEVLATVGDLAAGTEANWADVGHPVNSPTISDFAFLGKLSGQTAGTDGGVWWRSGTEPIALLAREGNQAPGTLVGEKFAAFTSLAFPGGTAGPIFVATLKSTAGTVNSSNNSAVWALDSSGSLRMLFRKGQKIGNKKVASFKVLSTVSGSPGVTRSFNSIGEVAWRATFTDSTTAIVVTQIP